MADPDNRVELTDLDVISRYSLAVRAATADRYELIATLRADLDWLQGDRRRRPAASTAARSAPQVEVEAAAEAEIDAATDAVAAAPVRRSTTKRRRNTADRRAPAAKKAT